MSWARLDDRLHGNPKMLRLWHTRRSAVALWVFGLTYCAQHETDGLVHEWFVLSLLPLSRDREADTGALVDGGLWDPHPEGWTIPDYLEFNPSRASLEERRARERERRERSVRARAQQRDGNVRARAQHADADVIDPDPTRPDPNCGEPPLPVGLTLVGSGMSDVSVRRARPSTDDLGGEVA